MQGSGTVAHVLHEYFPERKMQGWELDEVVLDAALQHMGLEDLGRTGALVHG